MCGCEWNYVLADFYAPDLTPDDFDRLVEASQLAEWKAP